MGNLTVTPEALEAFGAAHTAMATMVGTAGSIHDAATTAAIVGVFGVIGQEFVTAFVAAQAHHLAAVGELAAVHTATAAATRAGLAAFVAADHAAGAAIGTTR